MQDPTSPEGKAATVRGRFRPAAAFLRSRSGSYAVYAALAFFPMVVGVSAAIEYSDASRLRAELEHVLDASVLAGAREKTGQVAAAEKFFEAYFGAKHEEHGRVVAANFVLGEGVLDGEASRPMEMSIGLGFLTQDRMIRVRSQARFSDPVSAPCITVLANREQALLFNSGAQIKAAGCEIHVHSQKNPAMILNAGTKIAVDRLCVKGSKILNNGSTVPGLQTNCDAADDPYAGKFPEPAIPGSCTTSGARDGALHTIKPGLHCYVNFNGSPTVTFEPGLHIIRGDMNINSGATVVAEGVTFYFENTGSRIQANGGLTMTATAPKSGPYAGVLMFEKTSDAANNANKSPFVFNGSVNEKLEGIIHLPNRDVTYNSKTNISSSRISITSNTMIVNSSNWEFQGFGGGAGKDRLVYLSR